MSHSNESVFISWIKVSRLTYPLYSYSPQGNEVYFDIGEKFIYHWGLESNHSAPDPFPVAIDPSVTFRVKLAGSFHERSTYRLWANLRNAYTNKTDMPLSVFEESFNGTAGNEPIELRLKSAAVDGQPKPLPWQLRGELEWTIGNLGGASQRVRTTTPVEIYVFPANLPACLNKASIPLALLRREEYLPRWMTITEWSGFRHNRMNRFRRHPRPTGIPLTWARFAVFTLFSDRYIQYEQFNGSCRYVSLIGATSLQELFSKDRGFECWLDLWLDEGKRLDRGRAQTSANCYDLVALCQILISLGLNTRLEELRVKYMEPFGFIRDTRLIGRFEALMLPNINPQNLCNNPFFGNPKYEEKMLCRSDSAKRSSFGNHMFLTLGPRFGEPYVFDACCGPQLGTTRLSDYPSAVIDSSVALYGQPGQPSHPGSVHDMLDGPGVEDLVICRRFAKVSALKLQGDEFPTVLDLVVSEMSYCGVWQEAYVAVPANNRCITATWLLQPRPGIIEQDPLRSDPITEQHIITVTVSKYTSKESLDNDFNIRFVRPDGWSNSPEGGWQRSAWHGPGVASRAFKDDRALYLATMENTENTDGECADTSSLMRQMCQILGDAFLLSTPATQIRIIERPPHDLDVHPPEMPQRIGARLVVLHRERQRCRGFNVRMTREHVLFLDARQKKEALEFEFLARSPGYDTATITIYNGDMNMESRTVNFWVKDEVETATFAMESLAGLAEGRGLSISRYNV